MNTNYHQMASGIVIRDYRDSDESGWVNCRVQAFLDSSYKDDVHQYRERYENPSVRLVATTPDHEKIIGFLDVEYENKPGEVSNNEFGRGGVIWHLGVLPSYRRYHIATEMWQVARDKLIEAGIVYVETWTQDDAPANSWYLSQGFTQKSAYLNVYVRGFMGKYPLNNLLPGTQEHWKYGHVRNFNFEAPLEDREELEKLSYRIHEVRGYETRLN